MTSETANELLPIPATLDEAITRLLKLCPPETRDDVLYNGGQVAHYHSGFGRSLRNTWGLWEGICVSPLRDYFLNLGIWHADDMSGIVLESTFRVLRGGTPLTSRDKSTTILIIGKTKELIHQVNPTLIGVIHAQHHRSTQT